MINQQELKKKQKKIIVQKHIHKNAKIDEQYKAIIQASYKPAL